MTEKEFNEKYCKGCSSLVCTGTDEEAAKVWLKNIHTVFLDTYTYSKLKNDDERANLVLELYKKLVDAYFELEKEDKVEQ